jgi:DNA-binding NarL/FixJ family response regulator
VVLAEGDILQKLDVISRTEAMVKAKEQGIIG